MSIPTFLALIVVVAGVPLNLYATLKLRRLSRLAPRNRVLRAQYLFALGILLVVTVFGVIFLNNDLPAPVVGFDDTKWLTRGVVAVVAVVPALYWIRLYRYWS